MTVTDRTQGIGGSDAAAVLGLDPWKSPLDVYLEKIGLAPPRPENPRMTWGKLLEDTVAREYARRRGVEIRRHRRLLRHPDHPFIVGHIDRWVRENGTRGVLEVKTVGRRTDDWGPAGTDQVPAYYAAQVLHYLAVTGAPFAELAAFFRDSCELVTYRIPRDEEAIATLVEAEVHFWRTFVEPRVPPEPRTLEDIARRWPRSLPEKRVTATPEILRAVEELRTLQGEQKRLAEREKGLKAEIQRFMEDAEALVDDAGRMLVTWKTVASERIDTRRLKAEHPEIAAALTVRTESRRFLLRGGGR